MQSILDQAMLDMLFGCYVSFKPFYSWHSEAKFTLWITVCMLKNYCGINTIWRRRSFLFRQTPFGSKVIDIIWKKKLSVSKRGKTTGKYLISIHQWIPIRKWISINQHQLAFKHHRKIPNYTLRRRVFILESTSLYYNWAIIYILVGLSWGFQEMFG